MVDEESGLEVRQISFGEVPEGVTISEAPSTPAEAVAFELVPIPLPPAVVPPEEVPVAVPAPVEVPVPAPAPIERVSVPAVLPPPPKGVEVLRHYRGVVEEAGAGDYLGIVWADDVKHAQKLVLASFGGFADDYIVDQWIAGPKPFFVIKKLYRREFEVLPGERAEEARGIAVPEVKLVKTWIAKCPFDLSEWEVPLDQDEWVCPIDRSVIKRPRGVLI